LIDIAVDRRFPGGPSFRYEVQLATSGTTVLFGPSGCGKTTLLRLLAGLDTPDSGVIRFEDEVWFEGATRRLALPQRRRVGYVTQEGSLFPHLNVRENVAFGVAPSERSLRVPEALRLAGIESLAEQWPHEFSGGQRQRVALARAVAAKPRLLLLDEPLSALDAIARDELRRDLALFLRRVGLPVVLVTHDRTEALTLGDRIAVIGEGRVLQEGPIADVFNRPSSAETARILGIETVVPATITARSDEGLVTLDANGVTLTAIDPGAGIEHVFACIRADEVVIEPAAGPTSARNRLRATILAIRPEGPLVRIDLDCGFPLAASITRAALRDLELHDGSTVNAVVKAPAVHLIPRPPR